MLPLVQCCLILMQITLKNCFKLFHFSHNNFCTFLSFSRCIYTMDEIFEAMPFHLERSDEYNVTQISSTIVQNAGTCLMPQKIMTIHQVFLLFTRIVERFSCKHNWHCTCTWIRWQDFHARCILCIHLFIFLAALCLRMGNYHNFCNCHSRSNVLCGYVWHVH